MTIIKIIIVFDSDTSYEVIYMFKLSSGKAMKGS